MLVSIIVPSYNAESKIIRCLESLASIELSCGEFEVIFVDDASTDETINIIRRFSLEHQEWRVIQLDSNSGSPSHPRNVGVENSRGKYVFFLDADDEIVPSSFDEQCIYALKEDFCIVRSSLLVKSSGREAYVANQITDFDGNAVLKEKISSILQEQSTTSSSLVKTKLLRDHNIVWPRHLHMGEDTVFLLDVLTRSERIGYVDNPGIIYNKTITSSKSATQRYGSRELASHLEVWEYAENILTPYDLSYISMRGQAALKTVIGALYQFYTHDIEESQFVHFSAYIRRHWSAIEKMTLSERVKDTLQLIRKGDYVGFLHDIKPRLVVAGGDLKFIDEALPELGEYFQIRVDHWGGHDSHDPHESAELLEWAEIIWCEWLLGNAVWYADRKRWNQKLIVRLHLFELNRDFGLRLDQSKVDVFIAVSVPTAEDMIETFQVARSKVRVVPNFIPVHEYRHGILDDRVYTLGIVGILPRRKGYLDALRLLKSLRDVDKRYKLEVLGKVAADLPWVYNDPTERRYFDECETYIRRNDLEEAVESKGWVDTKTGLAEIGFVLSMSEFESFHVAPAEAFAAGNQAVFLPWPGVEYVYPSQYIFKDVSEMKNYILSQRDIARFHADGNVGQKHVQSFYALSIFISRIRDIVVEL